MKILMARDIYWFRLSLLYIQYMYSCVVEKGLMLCRLFEPFFIDFDCSDLCLKIIVCSSNLNGEQKLITIFVSKF